jgi:hypothetical protein
MKTDMSEKLKIYSISVMAFKASQDVLELSFIDNGARGEDVTHVEQLPAIVPAHSIKEAAEQAKVFAFNRWTVEDGWYGHQACILPVTKDFYEKAFVAHEAGVVDTLDESEPGECFSF